MSSETEAGTRTWGVLGVPSSVAAHWPGIEQGPAALRKAGLLETLRAHGVRVADHGDLAVTRWTAERVDGRPNAGGRSLMWLPPRKRIRRGARRPNEFEDHTGRHRRPALQQPGSRSPTNPAPHRRMVSHTCAKCAGWDRSSPDTLARRPPRTHPRPRLRTRPVRG